MAVGDGSVPSATPPLLARSRLALAMVAAADAVACVWLASAWTLFAGCAAMGIGDFAFGEDVANAAAAIGLIAVIPTLLVCPAAMLLLTCFLPRSKTDGEKAPACPRSSVEVTREDLGDDPVAAAALIGSIAFFFVHLLGFLVAGNTPSHVVKGSRSSREIIGCAMFDLGYFGMAALLCLILIPKLALKIWKMRRSGWQWGTPFETEPKTGESDVTMDKELQVLTLC